jgi:hypothetical protein
MPVTTDTKASAQDCLAQLLSNCADLFGMVNPLRILHRSRRSIVHLCAVSGTAESVVVKEWGSPSTSVVPLGTRRYTHSIFQDKVDVMGDRLKAPCFPRQYGAFCEAIRVDCEASRVDCETSRVDCEASRVDCEASRVDCETSRAGGGPDALSDREARSPSSQNALAPASQTLGGDTIRAVDVDVTVWQQWMRVRVFAGVVMERVRYTCDEYIRLCVQRWPGSSEWDVRHAIVVVVARALEAVQRAYGFEHNDLHPNNVMFRADGSVVFIDMEFARALCSATSSPTTAKRWCVGSELATKDYDCKAHGLPTDPYTEPLRTWYDLAFFANSLVHKSPYPNAIRAFLDAHGVYFNTATQRPQTIRTPFTPSDYVRYADDRDAYLAGVAPQALARK